MESQAVFQAKIQSEIFLLNKVPGCLAALWQRVLPAELPQHELVVALLLVLGLHAQHAARHVYLE